MTLRPAKKLFSFVDCGELADTIQSIGVSNCSTKQLSVCKWKNTTQLLFEAGDPGGNRLQQVSLNHFTLNQQSLNQTFKHIKIRHGLCLWHISNNCARLFNTHSLHRHTGDLPPLESLQLNGQEAAHRQEAHHAEYRLHRQLLSTNKRVPGAYHGYFDRPDHHRPQTLRTLWRIFVKRDRHSRTLCGARNQTNAFKKELETADRKPGVADQTLPENVFANSAADRVPLFDICVRGHVAVDTRVALPALFFVLHEQMGGVSRRQDRQSNGARHQGAAHLLSGLSHPAELPVSVSFVSVVYAGGQSCLATPRPQRDRVHQVRAARSFLRVRRLQVAAVGQLVRPVRLVLVPHHWVFLFERAFKSGVVSFAAQVAAHTAAAQHCSRQSHQKNCNFLIIRF